MQRTVAAKAVFMAWQEAGPDGRVRPVMELEADAGQVQQHTQSGSFERAEARVYRDGALLATLTAPRVEATSEQKHVKAWGGITIVGQRPPGLHVWADKLEWYLDTNKIVVLGHVRFVQKDLQTGGVLAEGGVFDRITIDTERERLTIP